MAIVRRMVVLRVDDRNLATAWWEALEARLRMNPEAVPGVLRRLVGRSDHLEVDLAEARAALAWAAGLPGWEGGPRHAPHPLRMQPKSI
jgi:hypothetical protein